MFTVDGMEIDLPCTIERQAELTTSEVSGMLLDKNYMNDVLGTFMQYAVKIAVPIGQEGLYSALYEILSDPVDAHEWIFPYNQDTITITARVDVISDKYYREENGVNIWRGTSFTVTANHPSKEYSLGEAIARGITPAPPVTNPEIGDTYLYSSRGWEMVAGNLSNGEVLAYDGDTWNVTVENPSEGALIGYGTADGWAGIISEPSEGSTVQYDGSSWGQMEVVNLDEVQF